MWLPPAASADLRERAPPRLEHAPALERREEPRGELRILRIERQHGLDDEGVAAPSARLNSFWFAIANALINARTRLGLANEKAGCAVSAFTRSSVAGSGIDACKVSHLSTTSGSSR